MAAGGSQIVKSRNGGAAARSCPPARQVGVFMEATAGWAVLWKPIHDRKVGTRPRSRAGFGFPPPILVRINGGFGVQSAGHEPRHSVMHGAKAQGRRSDGRRGTWAGSVARGQVGLPAGRVR